MKIMREHRWYDARTCTCGKSLAHNMNEHIAEQIEHELINWNLLMEILDHYYPESIFPTADDQPERDPGPRIVSLIRNLNAARDAS